MTKKVKNILVLAASPREDGNSDLLAREFCDAAQEKGCKVTLIYLRDNPVNPCRACEGCWASPDRPCVQKDGMSRLYPLLEEADMVTICAPLYFFGFPAQIKAVLDRLYPYGVEDAPKSLGGKLCQMIICGESDNEDDYEAVCLNYDLLANYLEWEDYGVLLATGLSEPGAVSGTDWLQSARDLCLDIETTMEED